MSRSNPIGNMPNPASLWWEWNGAKGELRYYDKDAEKNIAVPAKGFTFLVLDELFLVKGYHEDTKTGMQSNEVRDTRVDPFVVKLFRGGLLKMFKNGVLAEGLYADIRDHVTHYDGRFTTNLYIGFKETKDGPLKIGSLQFHGAALNNWVDFKKKRRKEIYEQAVQITGSVLGEKGAVRFHKPTFALVDVSQDTQIQAKALDIELQEYLKGYFERTRLAATEREAVGEAPVGEVPQETPGYDEEPGPQNFRTKPGSRVETPSDGSIGDPEVPF